MKRYMERIGRIVSHPAYQEAMRKIEAAEKDRIYCTHGFSHQLDTARIAYILYLEENGIPKPGMKELLYAGALLHDLGRCEKEGLSHEEAGAALAGKILPGCGFNREETAWIAGAVRTHRTDRESLLYRADKLSRCCFSCAAAPACNWDEEKKNQGISY